MKTLKMQIIDEVVGQYIAENGPGNEGPVTDLVGLIINTIEKYESLKKVPIYAARPETGVEL